MKDFFVHIWIIVIIAVVVVATGLGLGLFFGLRGGPPAGSLPTWREGNQWVYEWSLGTYTGNLTMNVTGQDVDCYTLDLTFDPAMIFPQ